MVPSIRSPPKHAVSMGTLAAAAAVSVALLVTTPAVAASSPQSATIATGTSARRHSASDSSLQLAFASAAGANRSSFFRRSMFSGGEGGDGDGGNDGNSPSATTTTDSSGTTDTSSTTTEASDKPKLGTYNPLRLAVLKLGFTELRWTSLLNYEKRSGSYKCANCNTELFDSDGKYDSGSGWPSFWRTSKGKVSMYREFDGRIECRCGTCGGHLGHVFPDGPWRMDIVDSKSEVLESIPDSDLTIGDPTNKSSRLPRYCMNGAALKFRASE